MRGQKHTDETRIKAMELLSVYSVADVARQLNLPESTVRTWAQGKTKASKNDAEHFVELRSEKKAEFVAKAWDSLILGQNRLLNELKDPEAKISARDLAIIIGTLYDKQALASNEATLNAGIKITLGGDLDKYAD